MKRLLSCLFMVLGLVFAFNINAYSAVYCVDDKIDERIENFRVDYIKRENEFFYFSSQSEKCMTSYKKVSSKKYNYLKKLFNKEISQSLEELKKNKPIIINDIDRNIEKLYRNIMNSNNFLKKNKYYKLSKKKKISGKKNEIIVLAVYFDYEKELFKLTNNPEINEIDIKAWSWVSSDRNLDWTEIYGYAGGSLNSKVSAKCYKKALKLKLEGGDCILVDARKPTGSWDPPTINKNLLFHERETRTLKNGFKSQYLINKIAKQEKTIEDQKKQKEKQLAEAKKKKKEKEKQLAEAKKKKKEKEKQLLAEKKKKEKEKQLLAEKKEAQKLERRKKILSLFNETDLEKSQKIINYTKEFVEIYPDEFDILQIAKKILAVKPISDGVINKSSLDKLSELQKFTSKSEKFKTYEIQILKKEKTQKIQLANIEIEKLDKKIKESKIYLSKNIDNKYAEDLIDLISKAEKTFLNLSSLDEIQKRNEDLDLLISKIDTLNYKINISKEINNLLKEKLKKSLSSELAPSLIELIENFENAFDSIDIAYLDKLIQEANVFIDEELSVVSSKKTSVEENKSSKIKNEDSSNKIEKNKKKINETVKTIDKTKVKEKITKSLDKTKVKEKITKSLDKTLGKLSKDIDLKNQNILDLENKTVKKKESNKNKSNKKKTNQNKSDFLKLRTSEYLTIEAFKRDFDNKTVFLKKDSYNSQDQIVFKVNIKQLANGSNWETAGVETDIYYNSNNKWEKQKIKIYYFEDVYTCDPNARNSCELGAINLYLDVMDYSYGITYEKERTIGNTITSPAGYKLVPLYEVIEGDRSYNPNEYRVISPNRRNEAEYAVIKLSKDDSYITKLDNSIQSSESSAKAAQEKKQKKDTKAKAKQKGFKEKISLSCTYIGGAGSRTVNYQFGLGDDGKGLSFEGIPAELGVEINDSSGGDEMYFLATRVGKHNIKAKLITSGMQVNYEIDLKDLKAMSEVFGQVVMAQCMKF